MSKGRGAAVVVIAAVTVSLDLLAHPHGETWWHHAPGFDLVFGFVGCAVIVLVSKALGKAGLQRPERGDDDVEGDSAE
jgi:hypothetical protein